MILKRKKGEQLQSPKNRKDDLLKIKHGGIFFFSAMLSHFTRDIKKSFRVVVLLFGLNIHENGPDGGAVMWFVSGWQCWSGVLQTTYWDGSAFPWSGVAKGLAQPREKGWPKTAFMFIHFVFLAHLLSSFFNCSIP